MTLYEPEPLDIIRELQLRRWARINFVPASMRNVAWHPVVHEEMQKRDEELAEQIRSRPSSLGFVPLPPTFISRIDAGHESPGRLAIAGRALVREALAS